MFRHLHVIGHDYSNLARVAFTHLMKILLQCCHSWCACLLLVLVEIMPSHQA